MRFLITFFALITLASCVNDEVYYTYNNVTIKRIDTDGKSEFFYMKNGKESGKIWAKYSGINDGFSGYLSEVGDIKGMAKNALKILKDDTVLAEFKKNALVTARQFDIKKILPLYEDLYRRAIAKYL